MDFSVDVFVTMPSSFDLKVPQIQFIDSGWIFLLFTETGTHSANSAVGILQVPFLDQVDMPVMVHRQMRSSRGMSSTPLSWRRCRIPWQVLPRDSPAAVH